MNDLVDEFRQSSIIKPARRGSDEWKHNSSLAHIGHPATPGFSGHNHGWCRKCGKFHNSSSGGYKMGERSLEHCFKISKHRKAYCATPKGKEWLKETIELAHTPEATRKWNESYAKYIATPKGRENTRKWIESIHTPEANAKRAKIRKEQWADPNSIYNSEEYQTKLLEGMHRKPTNLEIKFNDFLQEHFPNKWKYTGDYSFWIRTNGHYRNPDYRKVNSSLNEKQVIELFGDYWHQNDNPQDLVDAYADAGWECLVIWEHELNDETTVTEKIRNFVSEENK